MHDFTRMISVLFIACGLAAGSLSLVNAVTKHPIEVHEQEQREAALREVSPDADEFKEITPGKVWEALRNGQKAGHVFLVQVRGYSSSGPITLMLGIDSEGVVTGLQVLSHTETPGLGAKIAAPQFRDQFRNKRLEQLILKKDDPAKGQIDAVTGATISSRAVTTALRSTLESFNKEKAGEGK